jgi:3-oxoacyl-[acyl-carrier protein] reductase
MLLKNKTAVVTGCNRGIGRAVLEIFAENGADVFACVRKESKEFTDLVKGISSRTGVTIQPIFVDLKNVAEVKEAVTFIVRSKKKVNVLVNNAGVAARGLVQMTPILNLKDVFEVNFFAQIHFSQGMSRYMTRFKEGSIINIGSTAGLIGHAGTMSYGSSKAALMYTTKVMATELGPSNIRVNAIAPGITKTEMFDQMDEKPRTKQIEATALNRAAEAKEIANVALFLASDLSTYITGQVIRVDGGMTM